MEILLAGPELFGKIWEEAFSLRGWKIKRVLDFKTALDSLPKAPGAIVLSEAILPDALSLRSLREKIAGLSLLVASQTQDPKRLVELLNAGTDDVIGHAMPGELLSAKLEAVLRRFKKTEPRALIRSKGGDIEINRLKREARQGKKALDLTRTEFDLLSFILERSGSVFERRTLLQTVWGEADVLPATVDKHIEALRKKLGEMGVHIKTVHGVGYAWSEELGTVPNSGKSWKNHEKY